MYKDLENKLSYVFKDKKLLLIALTHSSYNNASINSNERLEFLGDRILGFTIADILYTKFPNYKEGVLAKLSSYLISKEVLVELASKLQLQKYIKHKSNLEQNVLADCVEAIFAAIYLDSNIDIVKNIIFNLLQDYISDNFNEDNYYEFNPKSLVQNWVQQQKLPLPEYIDIDKIGEEHKPIFTIKLVVNGYNDIISTGESKKIAQKNAALEFIKLYIKNK